MSFRLICVRVFYRVFYFVHVAFRWLGSRVVSVLDSGAEGPGSKSQPRRCPLKGRGGSLTAGLAENTGSLPPGL